MNSRYFVRENGTGSYGVWNAYLQMWIEVSLSEYDAEVTAAAYNNAQVVDCPHMYDEPDYGIGLR